MALTALALLLVLGAAPAQATTAPSDDAAAEQPQPVTATVTAAAPIFIQPNAVTPLRVAAVGTLLIVLKEEGDWTQVEFQDPQWGRRVGWVQTKSIKISRPDLRPMDLSVKSDPAGGRQRDDMPPASQPPAQPISASTPPPALVRKGFLIGFAIGGGSFGCSGCDWLGGGSFSFQVGGMLTERLGLMYDGAAVAESNNELASSIGTLAAQYWVSKRGWVKGGGGFGMLLSDCCSETGPAVIGAAGVELVQRRKFVMDLQGRVAATKLDEGTIRTILVGLGFNWY